MSVKVSRLKKADSSAVRDIRNLLSQLRGNPSEHRGTLSDIKNIIGDRKAVMIVARDGRRIMGMGTLYVIAKVGKNNGTVEDVVVDTAYRGQGLGEKIMQKLIAAARAKKVKTLYLTSRPSRIAANNLYKKIGFEIKKTNVYQMKLDKR